MEGGYETTAVQHGVDRALRDRLIIHGRDFNNGRSESSPWRLSCDDAFRKSVPVNGLQPSEMVSSPLQFARIYQNAVNRENGLGDILSVVR